MRKKLFSIIAAMALLTGCATSLTLPLQGDFNKGSEKFLGQATGKLDGSGTLSMATESGTQCVGIFQYGEARVSGTGTFDCDDGRKGTFNFTSQGNSGIGFGKTSKGESFRFSFGKNQVLTSW